nr:hypothetical protein BaRGS_027805 [Batillaria attramentaria]
MSLPVDYTSPGSSSTTSTDATYVISGTVLLLLVGLVGNPLALYIYGWRWQQSSTKIFLSCLAVVDLMNCLITIPTEIMIMRNFYYFDSDGLCKVSRFTTYVMNNATVVIFLAIAVDRYIRICHPYRKPISQRQAKIACLAGLMVGLTVGWPALLLYGRIEIQLPVSADPVVFITGAMCLVHSDMQGYTLAFFSYLCSAFFVCALVLIILYTLIGRTILKRKRLQRMRKQATAAALENLGARPEVAEEARSGLHNHSNGNSSPGLPAMTSQMDKLTPDDEVSRGCNVNNFSFRKCKKLRPPKATLMLFLITVVFIVSFLPFLIISIIRQHRGSSFYSSLSSTEQVVVNIFLRSYIVNNCSNPVVYGLCNSQFRAEFQF